ncbi:MAG: AAA family ATPase, partial [archaeon]
MKIKKLIIKNIRSYEDQEIDFPDGSLLLSGDVGSGKTSILLAIEYALFGLQPGQTGSALLRNNTQNGGVSLEIELDGSTILIERKLKKGKTVTNEYSALTIDGIKTEYAITELKTRIIQLLGYPSEFIKKNNLLYKYTVYTPQEQMKQIISEDPEIRLNMLRHIFGVEKYKRIRENLVVLLNRLKDESKLLQLEISAVDSDKIRLTSTRSFITLLGEKIVSQDHLIDGLKVTRKSIEAEVVELEKKIKEKEKLEIELEKTKVLYSSKRENLSDMDREHIELESFIQSIPSDFNENELLETIDKIAKNNKDLDTTQSSFIDCLS